MNSNGNNQNGGVGVTAPGPEFTETTVSHRSTQLHESVDPTGKEEAVDTKFATRAARTVDGMSKGKLILLGGGLLAAVLFFVFTATVSRSPKKQTAIRALSQQAKQESPKPSKESVTPLMDAERTQAPDNSSGQLGPGDIRRTRSIDKDIAGRPPAAKPPTPGSLGSVPSFADTQQKWVDPAPYGGAPAAEGPPIQQNALKEPSLVFVRSVTQNPGAAAPRPNTDGDAVVTKPCPNDRKLGLDGDRWT